MQICSVEVSEAKMAEHFDPTEVLGFVPGLPLSNLQGGGPSWLQEKASIQVSELLCLTQIFSPSDC